MTEDSNQNKQTSHQKPPPPTPPISDNKGDNKPNGEGGGQDSSKKEQIRLDLPQPFIVKEEKKKWWQKTSKIIPFFALAVSIYAVLLTNSTFNATTKRNEIEYRPIVQPVDINITGDIGKPYIINFNISNLGKFPAKVLTGRIGTCYGHNLIEDSVDAKAKLNDFSFLVFLGSGVFTPYSITGDTLTSRLYEEFKRNNISIYLVGDIVCQGTGLPNKYYSTRFMYKIDSLYETVASEKKVRILGIRNDIGELKK